MSTHETDVVRDIRAEYEYGWSDPEHYVFKSARGLSHELVEAISGHKAEPEWMREFRHRSLDYFLERPMPGWGADLSGIDFDSIYYYIKPTEKQAETWEDLPADIKDTWDKLGIPEAEKKYLAGVGAQYESEVVYHKLQADLEAKGVVFLDMDSACASTRSSSSSTSERSSRRTTTSSPPSTRRCGRAARSSTCLRESPSRCRSRPTSGSTRRTWASSSGR